MRRWLDRGLSTVVIAGVAGVAAAPAPAALEPVPFGTITEFPTAPGSRPLAIVAGPDGALWFTQTGANKIGRMSTDGVLTDEWTVPTPNSSLDGIAIGPDGSVWFAEVLGNKIGRLRPDRTIVEYAVPTLDSRPTEVAVGPDGNVWFTERGTAAAPGSKVGRVEPSTGSVTDYAVRTGSRPLGIVGGPDGNVWFTESAGNRVGRVSTAGVVLDEYEMPQPNSQPWEPTVGPDGAIWFTQIAGNRIGRLTVGGALTEYAVPTAASQPNVIASGPRGATTQSDSLWFAQSGANRIARITTGGASPSSRSPRPTPSPSGSPPDPTVMCGSPSRRPTAGDATLSVADPSPTATGRLVNGSFSLPQPLMAKASSAAGTGSTSAPIGGSASPTTLLTYAGPTSDDAVTVSFQQAIGAADALRTGSYAKTLTFTLSTTAP